MSQSGEAEDEFCELDEYLDNVKYNENIWRDSIGMGKRQTMGWEADQRM